VVVVFTEITLDTGKRKELADITERVASSVSKSGVRNGICLIHSLHSTSALILNENEEGLRADLLKKISEDYPPGIGWLHDRIDDNADGHLAGAFIGPSIVIPVKGGAPVLGTWQSIFFLELDGPRRRRRIMVEVMGEG
jgi:secondary thiamine-phosphate synthase enzyme